MAIWVSSDWHCDPDGLNDAVVNWIKQGKEENHRLIGDGDMFNIIPWGRKKWRDAAAIKQLAEVLGGYPFTYVSGNHDPYPIMKELLAPYSNVTVLKQLEFNEAGRNYYIIHGHTWSVDWGFLGISRIAQRLVEFMIDHMPGLWYRFCRWRGWLASKPKLGATEEKERERISRLVRIIWAGATSYALKYNCCVIIGHTHTTSRAEHGISEKIGFKAYMVDDGTLMHHSYVKITDDALLEYLP